ncbi:conserved hypothetical protein [Paraburkholderia caribensis]|nr:conserved hypothetical protein [Paraburkholderia caribensis]
MQASVSRRMHQDARMDGTCIADSVVVSNCMREILTMNQTVFPVFSISPTRIGTRLHTPMPPEVEPDPAPPPDDDPAPDPSSPPIPGREPDRAPPSQEPPAGDPPERAPPMHAVHLRLPLARAS